MGKAILKSYCKINLSLNVGKKNKKRKLHNIQSLACLINLHDEIEVSRIKAQKDKIKFSGRFSGDVKKKDNSVNKCLLLLRTKGMIKRNHNYNILVRKNIPVFSGFGGGSSNAATLIKYFTKGRKLLEKDKSYFSKNLGSDLRLFFSSKQIFQKNLNQIIDLKRKLKFYFVLVYPFLKSSTKYAYSKVKVYKNLKANDLYKRNSKLKIIENLKYQENSLEKIVISKFPVIQKILLELRVAKNCQFSRLTGSGSACFGVFLTKKSADLGLKKIKKKFPKFWCVVGKTI
tara:strand:+ start:10811 stop:11671 length:861 start_codon:yes stop_codon:yes gene_type:complete